HFVQAANVPGTESTPSTARAFAQSTGSQAYTAAANLAPMAANAAANVGGSQVHENMQPFLTICFCIALQGIFPSQN
ncbi:MAG: phage tail protein, partial [Verrucomicrobiaceae bacterium]|nr:phage tail protein [Verrucomicrobiaceae bacterium]